MLKKSILLILLSTMAILLAGASGQAFAQTAAASEVHALGTPASGFAPNVKPEFSVIAPTFEYSSANYGTGGVALRNRRYGVIQISGVTGAVQAAYIYWPVLPSYYTTPPSSTTIAHISSLTVTRLYPTGLPTTIKVYGNLLAVGADPCWSSYGAYVFRAALPTNVVTGNGLYKITLNTGASGLTDGEDPWNGNTKFPLFEGASLVVVGTGSANVGIYDALAGTMFYGSNTFYNFYYNPFYAYFNSQELLDNIGYDGQIGHSRVPGASGETSQIEPYPSLTGTYTIAGPGGDVTNSDWDGSSGWPLPQLWDDTGHDISSHFASGVDWGFYITYSAPSDCVGEVAAVVSVQ